MKTDNAYRDRVVKAVLDFQQRRKQPAPRRDRKRQPRQMTSLLERK
jgi:hypothetical protein